MNRIPARLAGRVRLDFGASDLRFDLSAVRKYGRCLWLASDETASVERLVERPDGSYGDHASFSLAHFFVLPEGDEGEVDIEGLAVDDRFLWVVGSHALKRRKVKSGRKEPRAALRKFADIRRESNRYFLGRLPLEEIADGVHMPVRDGGWDAGGGPAVPAKLKMTKGRNRLVRMLEDDDHLAPFLGLPGKENGFDVEGLAVSGERIFLGLRGPVVGNRAIVLELECRATATGTLRPRRMTSTGRRYRKYVLDLNGLGVRDLCLEGSDLLILGGPTMGLSGPSRLFRWRGALAVADEGFVPDAALEYMMDMPYGDESDSCEGICIVDAAAGRRQLLAVYDSPAPERTHHDGHGVDADLFDLPNSSEGKAEG